MIKILVLFSIFNIASCDLIGYNRLGNNVHAHRRYRSPTTATNFQLQIMQALVENQEIPATNQLKNLKSIKSMKPIKNKRNRRFKQYQRTMRRIYSY